jgi:hypothetical protein
MPRAAHDASPNHRDGHYAGDFTLGAPGPFADAGNAVRLTTDGAVRADVPVASGSVELWVNPDRMAKNPQAPLVAHGSWALGVGPKRKLVWTNGGTTVQTKIPLSSGVWTALTLTWDGSKVRFYRNGALAKTLTGIATPTGGALTVGDDGNGGFARQFSGTIDEVALYRQVLTASDVSGHVSASNAPSNTGLPRVTGIAEVGETLTVHAGTWVNGGTMTHQWQRCDSVGENCVDLAGTTGPAYDLGAGDACSTLQAVETVTNGSGQTGSAVSNRIGVVEPCGSETEKPAPENDQPPAILGTPAVGKTLSAQPGVWSFVDDTASHAYEWSRCDGDTCAAVGSGTSYVLTDRDACRTFEVTETVSNATGADNATSERTAVVMPCGTGAGTGGKPGTGIRAGVRPVTRTAVGAQPATSPAACLRLLPGRKRVKVRGLGRLRLRAAAGMCVRTSIRAVFTARKGAKVRSVRYKLDGKRLKRVKRPRYGARLKASRLRAGTHTLTVRVRASHGSPKRAKLRLRLAVS